MYSGTSEIVYLRVNKQGLWRDLNVYYIGSVNSLGSSGPRQCTLTSLRELFPRTVLRSPGEHSSCIPVETDARAQTPTQQPLLQSGFLHRNSYFFFFFFKLDLSYFDSPLCFSKLCDAPSLRYRTCRPRGVVCIP